MRTLECSRKWSMVDYVHTAPNMIKTMRCFKIVEIARNANVLFNNISFINTSNRIAHDQIISINASIFLHCSSVPMMKDNDEAGNSARVTSKYQYAEWVNFSAAIAHRRVWMHWSVVAQLNTMGLSHSLLKWMIMDFCYFKL